MMRVKTILLALVTFLAILPMNAADGFVSFTEQNGAVALKGATIGFDAQEPKAVQIAVASLQQDFERVMGFAPMKSDQPTILVGTIGFNKKVDQWVKNGKLADLKGKREKFILTTIDGQQHTLRLIKQSSDIRRH